MRHLHQLSEKSDFVTVFIYPNLNKDGALECTLNVCALLNELGVKIKMSSQLIDFIKLDYIEFITSNISISDCDIVISVGGDGTILKCARLCAENDKELLGINCGRLGFMATLEKEDIALLSRLVSGDYSVEKRMVLDVIVKRSNGDTEVYNALNDAVVYHGILGKIYDFKVIADGTVVSLLRADGIIFSTPTGASAYSLSAGGPLIEPSLDCIEFTQICPHSLFARSMIFSPEKTLEVEYDAGSNTHVCLSIDGAEPIILDKSDKLYIKRSDMRVKLVDILGNSYFNAIGSKLMQPTKELRRSKENEG